MKNKLVVLFDNDSEVLGLKKSYIFCNEKDAKSFFLEYESIIEINLIPDDIFFSFKTTSWSGMGKCFWAVDKS